MRGRAARYGTSLPENPPSLISKSDPLKLWEPAEHLSMGGGGSKAKLETDTADFGREEGRREPASCLRLTFRIIVACQRVMPQKQTEAETQIWRWRSRNLFLPALRSTKVSVPQCPPYQLW